MPGYEMPVMVQLSKEELAHAAGRPVDDAEISLLGGLNVVLHPIASPHTENAAAALAAADPAAHKSVSALTDQLKPIEEKLFQHLRSSPVTAKNFLRDPVGTMEQLGVLDANTRSAIESHRQALAGVFAVKK